MSTNYLLRNGMIAALGITGLTLSACASGHNSGRYASVNDFESGGSNCGVTSSCDGGAVYSAHNFESGSRYGSAHSGHNIFNYEGVPGNCGTSACAPVAPAPVYADCGQIGQMACGGSSVQMYEPAPAPVYVAPEPAYTAPATTYTAPATTSYTGATSYSSSANVECPAGTTLQSDNTCLQGSSSYSTGVISSGTTSSYSSGTVSSYPSTTSYSSSHSSGGNVSCPSGTTLQSDNTCLQVSGSSVISSGSSYSSGTTYSSGTSYTGSTYTGSTSSSSTASCPSGTVMQGDGSCMTVGYSSSTYTQSDYMPIRK